MTQTFYHLVDRVSLLVRAAVLPVLFIDPPQPLRYHLLPTETTRKGCGPTRTTKKHPAWQTPQQEQKEDRKVCQKLVCGMKVLISCVNQEGRSAEAAHEASCFKSALGCATACDINKKEVSEMTQLWWLTLKLRECGGLAGPAGPRLPQVAR